VRLSVRW